MDHTILDELLNRVKFLESENDSLKQKVTSTQEKLNSESLVENTADVDNIEEFLVDSNSENSN